MPTQHLLPKNLKLNTEVPFDAKKEGIVYVIIQRDTQTAYIGYTQNTMNNRFKGHIKSSKYKDAPYRKLYHAFGKYGVETFDWAILDVVPKNQLAKREKELIAYYNTYHNGYNATRGGEGIQQVSRTQVEELFLSGMEVKDIAEEICCDRGTVSDILVILGYNPRANCTKNRSRAVLQYDIGGKYLRTFQSLSDAARYLQTIDGLSCSISSATNKIGLVARGDRANAYGYRWEYESDDIPVHPVFNKSESELG